MTAEAARRECVFDARHMARCGYSQVRIAHELTTGPLRGLWLKLTPQERVAVLAFAKGWGR